MLLYSCSVMSDSLWLNELQPARFLCPWNSQTRILEWVAISFSRGPSQIRDWKHISYIGRENMSHQESLVNSYKFFFGIKNIWVIKQPSKLLSFNSWSPGCTKISWFICSSFLILLFNKIYCEICFILIQNLICAELYIFDWNAQ